MRVLVANKFWYRRGGLERVMLDEIGWLEGAGHEVAHFSTAHPSNQPSPWERYFVPYLELGADGGLGRRDKLAAAVRMFRNTDAALRFTTLVDEFDPDVVHVHGIHRQLSPSILDVAHARNIPVVQTLHDYHHVCPADVLLTGDGAICEPRECKTVWYGAAVAHRCVRGSLAASALSAAETGYQRVRGVYERCVRGFISPSAFLAQLMKAGKWDVPCDVVPNAVPARGPRSLDSGDYVLYAGRLAAEKGVPVLLQAARRAEMPVVVAGEGPLEAELRSEYPEVSFLGRLAGAEVEKLIDGARACAVPSVWYENAPLSVLEPMAAGVPVVASAIGGIPELVEDGVSGLLVPPGDVNGLAGALVRLREDSGLGRRLGESAARRVAGHFSPERHLQLLLDTYEKAIAR